MYYHRTLVAVLLAPALASAQLNKLAVAAGLKYFGSALRESATSDAAYMAIMDDVAEIGALVPENGMKWDATEAKQGVFSYTSGDVVAKAAKANGQFLRCHTLVWYSQLPNWVSSGSWTKDTLKAVIENHISNVVGHYVGQCYAWDVVNEAVSDSGTWRDNVFYKVFGTDYFAIAFNAARAADPDAKLYYNDYNLEYSGAKANQAVKLVQLVQAAGAPIDGVGFQGHMIVGSTPSRTSLAAQLRLFTALGLEVAYTELDIRQPSLPPTADKSTTQAADYAAIVGSCLDVNGCVGVTVWGVTDKYSWVPSTFSGQGDACLYDKDLNKKPAWSSVSQVMLAAAATKSGSNGTVIGTSTGTSTRTRSSIGTATGSSSISIGANPDANTSDRATMTSAAPTTGQATVSTAAEPLQTHWGQCGGSGWAAPTACASPYKCEKLNPYYSQCL